MTVLGLGMLSACGDGSTPSPATSPAAPPTTATGSASPMPSATGSPSAGSSGSSTYLPSPEPELTVPARPGGQVERISGVVGEGVESGCRLLTPDGTAGATTGRALLLLSTDERLTPGARVTVEGHRNDVPAGPALHRDPRRDRPIARPTDPAVLPSGGRTAVSRPGPPQIPE